MKRWMGPLVVSAMVVVGCGGTTPSPAAPTEAAPATAAPTEAAPQPTEAVGPPSADSGGAAEGYLVCPALEGDSCPVPAGQYQVDIHDAFSLSVPDAGWVELPTATEEEPTLTLARADAPAQRLTIDSGPTGAILDDAAMLHLTDLAVAAGAGTPTPITIGGASGYQFDVPPDITTGVGLDRAGSVMIEPGTATRIAVVQVPYDQESALKVIVMAAPSADFETFRPLAEGVLNTVQFVQ